jgi:leucyl/phenylalanyl-tRNA--protein transferase
MPVFQLSDENIFPPPEFADESGLLAVGGDLREERLILAYSMGIFPWYSGDDPVLWWSPDPRLVLFPDDLRVSRSLNQIINKGTFKVTMDAAFERVIKTCAIIHKKEDGDTWITGEMIDAYIGLHKSGYSHSVESWFEGELVGGLYGVSLGSAFFGESMFTKKSNASKVAFVMLVRQLIKWKFTIIDCQVTTAHLKSFGAIEIPRKDFLVKLRDALNVPQVTHRWKKDRLK